VRRNETTAPYSTHSLGPTLCNNVISAKLHRHWFTKTYLMKARLVLGHILSVSSPRSV
jgi:hypothetical protein